MHGFLPPFFGRFPTAAHRLEDKQNSAVGLPSKKQLKEHGLRPEHFIVYIDNFNIAANCPL